MSDNPGSESAGIKGCTCPVLDNSHGRGYLCQPDVFVIREDCPLHADRKSNTMSAPQTSDKQEIFEEEFSPRGRTIPWIAGDVTRELDGFRVGDLVRNSAAPQVSWGPVTHVDRFVEVTYPGRDVSTAYASSQLTRKPVKEGDMVRCISGISAGLTGEVSSIYGLIAIILNASNGSTFRAPLSYLVAVDPKPLKRAPK